MKPQEFYELHLAIKAHFYTKQYDFFRYNGKIKAKHYKTDNASMIYESLSRKEKTRDSVIERFVAAIIYSNTKPTFIKDFYDEGSTDAIYKWKTIKEASWYNFNQDILTLCNHIETADCTKFSVFKTKEFGDHPLIFKLMTQNKIDITTLATLDHFVPFTSNWKKHLNDMDPFFSNHALKTIKLVPFVADNFKDREAKFQTTLVENLLPVLLNRN